MDPQPEAPNGGRSNRLVVAGGAVALLLGLGVAWMVAGRGGAPTSPPPASQGGLVIEEAQDQGKIDAAKPLRCFVAGQFVGELTLTECARRNGVATDALDVGIDESGALAAAQEAGTAFAPLPPQPVHPLPETPLSPAAPQSEALAGRATAAAAQGACWRHNRGQWRKLPGDLDLNACVQALYAGKCERAGAADYGRWGQQTLRLVTGKVEVSNDNQTFRTLVTQGPNCSLPSVG
jgi:hypothetical protein